MTDPGEQMGEAEEEAIVARIVEARHGRVLDGVDQLLDEEEFHAAADAHFAARALAEGWTRVEGGPEAVQRYLDELKERGVVPPPGAETQLPPPPTSDGE